jgi:hypothetical protein
LAYSGVLTFERHVPRPARLLGQLEALAVDRLVAELLALFAVRHHHKLYSRSSLVSYSCSTQARPSGPVPVGRSGRSRLYIECAMAAALSSRKGIAVISRFTASAADALSAESPQGRCLRTHVGPMQPTEVPHGHMRWWGTPGGCGAHCLGHCLRTLGWLAAAAAVCLHGDRAVVRVGEVELVLAVRVERVEQLRSPLPLVLRLPVPLLRLRLPVPLMRLSVPLLRYPVLLIMRLPVPLLRLPVPLLRLPVPLMRLPVPLIEVS